MPAKLVKHEPAPDGKHALLYFSYLPSLADVNAAAKELGFAPVKGFGSGVEAYGQFPKQVTILAVPLAPETPAAPAAASPAPAAFPAV